MPNDKLEFDLKRKSESYQLQRFPPNRTVKIKYKQRNPFWLPPSSYYILAAAVTIASFFFVWWILREGGEETPWIPAGFGASIVLGSAVFLREFVMRNARRKYLSAEKRLENNLNKAVNLSSAGQNTTKLSVQQNAAIIEEIKNKSEAARVLDRLPAGHWEVFELCNDYLRRNRNELKNVGVGSPRLAAFRRGEEIIKQIHKQHLLAWAEIESKSYTQKAKNQLNIADKLESAQNAMIILETALEFYPKELRLIESVQAISEFTASMRISHRIEQAEKAVFKGDYGKALDLYRDALFFLGKETLKTGERILIEEQINSEIKKLEQKLL